MGSMLVEACNPVALFARKALAILANMVSMTASGELLVSANSTTDVAVVSQVYCRV
jgi:hypothetical protein